MLSKMQPKQQNLLDKGEMSREHMGQSRAARGPLSGVARCRKATKLRMWRRLCLA
jgi:hypothetical protein